ncbi:MAG: ATP-binding protein [bacterium]
MEYKISEKYISEKNIVRNIEKIMEDVKKVLQIDEEEYFKIFLSTVEAINNAAEHGNKFNENKYVYFDLYGNEDYIEITIKDEGDGYLPDVEASFAKIECDANLCDCRGRGIFLIHSMMDEVSYNCENGTLIKMRYNFRKN